MQPELVEIEPFKVAGISVRTSNAAEMSPEGSRIGAMWGEFFSRNIGEGISNAIPDSPVYGIYSAYESDMNGPYTVTAGRAISGAESEEEEFARIDIEPGSYLVFKGTGAMPQVVFSTWQAVWEYFAQRSDWRRRYTTDFESYTGADEVAIYIAVERS